ncbi:oxygen-dependent coproporphyrinogen oxidase [Usitatibacter palustris]|uniref:Oxygen-dependent coproporphyrinogen-III oxidase n=1 Tax=Usitatibacter palustris TaxID=2732487 RepID=A0A6M4H3Y5_9PROT|nr:oxygen-dependent coproporphyrinogen oxidase [Usitatibacter palustris]QJR13413.1 Oxygen-dependent coproporphyrinogen-III oxidase [Usitatibacter palustris]
MNADAMRDTVRAYLTGLQDTIIARLEALDGGTFIRDEWTRAEGGGGITRILEGGKLFERAGVGFSHVQGTNLPPSASAHRPEMAGRPWEAMGVSLVLHPRNPHVPTVHMNVRFFLARAHSAYSEGQDIWWFGGGMDMTPYYAVEEDCQHFHLANRTALDAVDKPLYPKFKKACDTYFFNKHRNEPRGIGGTFFDDFSEGGFDRCFSVMKAVGDAFLPAYVPIVEKRRETPYGERERDFQAYRRGRYVEFNFVWDRGTLFGLQSGGRVESILMSMPPAAQWRYDWKAEAGSPEAKLLEVLIPPRDWA